MGNRVQGGGHNTPTQKKHDNYGPNGQRPDVNGNKPGGPDKAGGGNLNRISKHLDMASNIMGCIASAAEMLGALRSLGGGGGGCAPGGMPGMGMPGMGMPGMGMPGMGGSGSKGLMQMISSLLQMMGPLLMMMMASKMNNTSGMGMPGMGMPGMGMPGAGGCGACNPMAGGLMQKMMQMLQQMQGLQMAQQGLQMMQMGLHQMQSPMALGRQAPMPIMAGF